MSEASTQSSSLLGSNSVAEQLIAARFRKTGIARAVAELVSEYLGIHTKMSPSLVQALGKTNIDALQVLGKEVVSNDSIFQAPIEKSKTATHL